MNSEETIFAAALTRESAGARAAYLDDACAGDDALRRSVEALLLAHDRPAGILESPLAGGDVTSGLPHTSQPIGSTVGPYKLLEQIGGGGMGVVYMAEQLRPVRRKVALKIIKPGMDSGQVIARFEAERQALAMMDHANIAKVFDAGTTDAGRPYFAMELVKGIPITDYCDQARLSTRQRLELFVTVCQAVQHAHHKGVIHRDLKPTNVLVTLHDDKPVPKVIDFGIAKATGQQLTERTLFTNYAQMLGTPLYMSPEQAQISGLDVDTRSDVYSLGVLLYELLTGTTPFDKQRLREAAYDEMRRIIREEDPPNPSTRLSTIGDRITGISAHRDTDPKKLSQLVRGELDWIVMKALEKDRGRRYETANGLGRDVERYLRDEAVQACPPTLRYRLGKVVRKQRVPLAIATGFVFLLLAATAISSWLALRARRAEALAQIRLERATTESAKATAISDLLQQMLATANPDEAKGSDYTVRQLLDDSSDRLRDQLKDQPEVEAAVRAVIGRSYSYLGLTGKAEAHLRSALDIRRVLAGGTTNAQEPLAQSLLDYGWNLRGAGRLAEAEPHVRESLAIFKGEGVRKEKILEATGTLQLILNEQGKLDDAIRVAHEALALARQYFPDGHPETAKVLNRLALAMHRGKKDLTAAAELAERAVALHEQWHGNQHIETGWALMVLANIQRERGQLAEAEESFRRALRIFTTQYGHSHYSVPLALEPLRQLLEAKGDAAAVAMLQAEQRTSLLQALERDPSNLRLRIDVGNSLRRLGDADAASEKYAEVAERLTPEASPDLIARLAEGYADLARSLGQKQKPAEAERAFRQAISFREQLKGPSVGVRLALSFDYNELAFVLLPAKRLPEAEQAVRKGLELKQLLVTESPEDLDYQFHLAHSYLGLGYILKESGRVAEAVEATSEADRILTSLAAQASAPAALRIGVGRTLRQLGDAWRQLNRREDAERAAQLALKALPQPATRKQ